MTGEDQTDAEVIAAVTDTLLDYAHFVDTCEADKWAELFCVDGEFDEGRVVQGRDALAIHVRKLLRLFDATAHHISNIRIRRTGPKTATSTCYVYAWHQKTDGDDFEIWGQYSDELLVEEDKWRFSKRRVEMFGSRGWDIQLDRVARRSLD